MSYDNAAQFGCCDAIQARLLRFGLLKGTAKAVSTELLRMDILVNVGFSWFFVGVLASTEIFLSVLSLVGILGLPERMHGGYWLFHGNSFLLSNSSTCGRHAMPIHNKYTEIKLIRKITSCFFKKRKIVARTIIVESLNQPQWIK